ncbi:hypothetical protein WJX84_008474 [Apatococcus fuscideae]|uniref:Uncharacterized protein n=1 Tax=Apatococcus fuscideae TaxID=2026836 RepID=A0AAW1SWC5_9CHLO
MVPGNLTRAGSGQLEAHTASPPHSLQAYHFRSLTHRAPTLQRTASAPLCAVSSGAVPLTMQHTKAPLRQAVDYSLGVLQAELAWAREQLDRERSRSNGASSLEQRRAMLELAQQSQQVGKLEQALAQAHATIAQQTQEMALLGRRQALADWTSFADTRKRLWSSLEKGCEILPSNCDMALP